MGRACTAIGEDTCENVSTCALKKLGLTKRLWTRGFDKRFCFTDEQLEQKIKYVRRHDKTG